MGRALLVAAAIVTVLAIAAHAQSVPAVPRIGFLSPASPSSLGPYRIEAFRDALREHGYTDGMNVSIEARFANGRYDRLPEFAAELVQFKVDVIVAWTTPVALVAKHATKSIPIVFASVSDPVGAGLVGSLARPGGNITGYTDITADLVQKRLALLKELSPHSTRVGVLKNPDNPGVMIASSELDGAARRLGLELYAASIRRADDVEAAIGTLAKAKVGSLIVIADSLLSQQSTAIARIAAGRRLPLMGWSITWPQAGALLSYGAASMDVERRAALYVARILKGAKPAELPVEQATKFELIVNLKTASVIGLTVPQSLLMQADQVIQ